MGYTKDDYRNAGFDINQVMYIDYALRNGISTDVLELFIDINKPRKFSATQIEQIVIGLARNLTTDQVGAYAKPKYNSKVMSYAIAAFEADKSQKVFDIINSGKYKSEQLIQIIDVILSRRNFDAMLRTDLTGKQLKMVKRGINHNLTDDQIAIYADPKFSEDQMRTISWGLINNLDTSWFADPDFSADQMDRVAMGLRDKVDVSWYADPAFSSTQMAYLERLLKAGISESSIAKIAFPRIPEDALRDLSVLFTNDKIDAVDLYKKYKFDREAVKNSPEFALMKPKFSQFVNYLYNL